MLIEQIGPFSSASYANPVFTEAYNFTESGNYNYTVIYDDNSRLYQYMGFDITGDAGTFYDIKIAASLQTDWSGTGNYYAGSVYQLTAWGLDADRGLSNYDVNYNRFYEGSAQYQIHSDLNLSLKPGHYILELSPSTGGAIVDYNTATIKWNLNISFGDDFFTEDADNRNLGILTGAQQQKITEQEINPYAALGGDDVVLLPGKDSWIVQTANYSYMDHVFDAGSGNDTITGLDLNDRIRGGADADIINGGTGRDIIWGGDGDDTIEGGSVSDASGVLSGNELYGEAGNDILTGDDQADFIAGNIVSAPSGWRDSLPKDLSLFEDADGEIFTNQLNGLGGDDVLVGASYVDIARGGTGKDTIFGGGGDDFIFGDKGNDTLFGGYARDIIYGGDDKDTIYAAFYSPTKADNASDDLHGDGGDDYLYTWSVNPGDLVRDVAGDRLFGGTGVDNYFIKNGDWIEELEVGETVAFVSQRSLKQSIVFTSDSGTKFNFFDTTGVSQKVEQFQTGNRIDVSALQANSTSGSAFTYATFAYGAASPGTGGPTYTQLAKKIGTLIAQKTLDFAASEILGKFFSKSVADIKLLTPGLDGFTTEVLEKSLGAALGLIIGKATESYINEKPVQSVTGWDALQEGLKLFISGSFGARATVYVGDIIINSFFISYEHYLESAEWQNLHDAPATRTFPIGGLPVLGVGKFAAATNSADLAAAVGTTALNDTLVAKIDVTHLPDSFENLIMADVTGTTGAAASQVPGVGSVSSSGTTQRVGNGNASANTITGSSFDDAISGLEGDDNLSGNGGRDLLLGGDGDDSIRGDDGDDILQGGSGQNTLAGGNGVDTVSYADATHGVAVSLSMNGFAQVTGASTDTVSGFENLRGSDFVDRLTGSAESNVINGGSGADTMTGLGGNDTYIVDNTRDKVIEVANAGTDGVRSVATYTLTANVENLILQGTANINGTGNSLANTLTGNSGDNVLNGVSGKDRMVGGAGNDIYVTDGGDTIVETSATGGTDLVKSSATLTLGTYLENLTLTGSTAINGTGNDLANTLTGNVGANVLTGARGADKLYGNAGADTFLFKGLGDSTVASAGRDTIMDFSHKQGDHINLHYIDAVVSSGVNDAFKFIGSISFHDKAGELRAVIAGSNTLVSGDVDGDGAADFSILLRGALTLQGNDFIL